MNIYLRAWGNAFILYTLNPKTGSYSCEKITDAQKDDILITGHASFEPVFGLIPRFYAVYGYDGRLYLQAGSRKWDITDAEVETGYWCGFGLVSGFHLLLNGKSVHRATLVHPSRAIWPFIDPTYDGIDFHSDHFLAFLSEQLTIDSWKQRVLARESNLREPC